MSAPADLTLIYFPFPGRAAAIRDVLKIGRIAFEDQHVAPDALPALQASGELPFDAVPVLKIGDRMVSQSDAILRYVGKLAGLYPDDPATAMRVDEAMAANEDMTTPLGASFREEDPARKAAIRADLADVRLPFYFGRFERLLQANGNTGFLVGDDLTIADLRLMHTLDKLTDGSLDGIPPSVIDPFETLKRWLENVRTVRARRLGQHSF
jgi:glutathione S-transferase